MASFIGGGTVLPLHSGRQRWAWKHAIHGFDNEEIRRYVTLPRLLLKSMHNHIAYLALRAIKSRIGGTQPLAA
jgi:hypothetical protein